VVNPVSAWATAHGYSRLGVGVAAANDLEPGFGPASTALGWTTGFTSYSNLRYYDYGSADGCPGLGWSGTTCGGGWTLGDEWAVAGGHPQSRAVPEIYTPSGSSLTNGSQWANISLWGALARHSPLHFAGEMTEYIACEQVGGCPGIDNSPSQGWTELWKSISATVQTRLATLPWSTDIRQDG
jgi:hypothetical protein